ncbi:uncharacterized protein RBU33_026619 isoform 1-T1 [Hipposideros larvatus]
MTFQLGLNNEELVTRRSREEHLRQKEQHLQSPRGLEDVLQSGDDLATATGPGSHSLSRLLSEGKTVDYAWCPASQQPPSPFRPCGRSLVVPSHLGQKKRETILCKKEMPEGELHNSSFIEGPVFICEKLNKVLIYSLI